MKKKHLLCLKIGWSIIEKKKYGCLTPQGILANFPPDIFPGTELLNDWTQDLIENHSSTNGQVILSTNEFSSWIDGVRAFQQYWFENIGCGAEAGNVYGCPVDGNLKPDALINLFNKSLVDCN